MMQQGNLQILCLEPIYGASLDVRDELSLHELALLWSPKHSLCLDKK
jgi:hypothetical protein